MRYIIQISTILFIYLYSQKYIEGELFFWYALFLGLYQIVSSRKCKPIAIMYFFWFTYILVLSAIYVFKVPFVMFLDDVNHQELCDKVLINHTFFLSVVIFFQKKIHQNIYIHQKIRYYNNPVIFWGLSILMLLFVNFAISGDSIVQSGGYTKGESQQFGGLLPAEYFLLLVPIANIYSGGDKLKKIIVIIITAFFAIKGLLFGGRIIALQVILILFILFFDTPKLTYLKMIIPLLIGYLLFTWFGKIRADISNWQNVNFFETTGQIGNDVIQSLGNQYDIFYASARLYAFVEMGILTEKDRLVSFFFSHVAIFVPFKYLPDLARLGAYKQDEYYSGGGSLISANYFIYAGYFGIFLIGWLVSSIINKITVAKTNIFLLYGIMVLSTFPRWFGYNFITLFKLCFYIIPIYLIVKHIVNVRNFRSYKKEYRKGNSN